MKKESFIAGYSFVKGIRAIAYTLLLLGLLGATGWGIFQMVTTSTALVLLSQKYDLSTKHIEQQKADLEEMKRRNAQEEADFISGHEKRIADARSSLNSAVEAFNREVTVAVNEVKKVSPLSFGYQFDLIQIPNLDTAEACEQYLVTIEQKKQALEGLKQEMYKSINHGLNTLVASVREKQQGYLAKIAEQEKQIKQLEQEIRNILNSYRVRRKIITIIPRQKELMNKAPLYEAAAEETNRINTGRYLPGIASEVMSNELLDSKQVDNFRDAVARLVGWLPYLRESADLKKETTHEEIDQHPQLTDEDKQRIQNLRDRIKHCNEAIARLREELNPIEQQLNTLTGVNEGVESSKDYVLSDWVIMKKIVPVTNSANKLKKEIADYPMELKKMRDRHSMQVQLMEKNIAALIKARDTAWDQACAGLGWVLLFLGVLATLGGIAASWIMWTILLIIADFVVSNLIIAMRAQDIQLLLEKSDKN